MNIYKPYKITTDFGVSYVRDYTLYLLDVTDMLIVNKTITRISIEPVELTNLNFYSGFLLVGDGTTLDLRANEGINFNGATNELKQQIESYLHSYALDEEQARRVRIRQATKENLR